MFVPVMDAGDSIATNHISKSVNKTHFSHDGEKSGHGIYGKHSDMQALYGIGGQENDSDNNFGFCFGAGENDYDNFFKPTPSFHKIIAGDKIKHHKMASQDDRPVNEISTLGEQIQDIVPAIAMGNPVENTMTKTDFAACMCANADESSENEISHDCAMTGKSEGSCSGHDCCCDVVACNEKVIINKIDDDSTYCYNDYYAQFNTTAGENETTNSRNRNSKYQDICQSEIEGYIIPSNRNLDGEFSVDCDDAFNGEFTRFDCSGLNIVSQYPQADIADYNMEYYIFTNPDIIIEKANVNVLQISITYTNHCLTGSDATDLNQLVFNKNFSAENRITDDNYFPIETTFFKKALMLVQAHHQDNLPISHPVMKLPLVNYIYFGGIQDA